MFDYNKLRGRIREVFGTQSKYSEALHVSYATLSAKLNNQTDFTQGEISKSVELLQINSADIPAYFFTKVV